MRRSDLDKKPPEALFKSNVLCEVHFKETSFSPKRINQKRKILLKHAVPDIFHFKDSAPLPFSRPSPKNRSQITVTNTEHDSEHDEISSRLHTAKKMLHCERNKVSRLKKKLIKSPVVASTQSDSASPSQDLDHIKTMLEPYLTPAGVEFVLTQCKVSTTSNARVGGGAIKLSRSLSHCTTHRERAT